MDDITIVTSWDSIPPLVYSEGEYYSTRVLARQHRQLREALVDTLENLELALAWIDSVPADVQLPTMPVFCRDTVDNEIKEARNILNKVK